MASPRRCFSVYARSPNRESPEANPGFQRRVRHQRQERTYRGHRTLLRSGLGYFPPQPIFLRLGEGADLAVSRAPAATRYAGRPLTPLPGLKVHQLRGEVAPGEVPQGADCGPPDRQRVRETGGCSAPVHRGSRRPPRQAGRAPTYPDTPTCPSRAGSRALSSDEHPYTHALARIVAV